MSISQTTSGKIPFLYSLENRLQISHLLKNHSPEILKIDGKDAIAGLTKPRKSLPPRYFYDDKGSQLFEQICELPEYYLTRTETAILQECASEIGQLTGVCELVELGSGSSTKTRILLDAYQELGYSMRYLPIDVSGGILESSARQLLAEYPALQIHGLVSTYELALQYLEPRQLPTRTICFIGSTLGNMTPQECDRFCLQIKSALEIGEYFLLGIDLQKPKDLLEAAYNDRQGVTAAFNLNMLQHLNWRFDGNFDLTQFKHLAFYNESEHQIEMHLQSLRSQSVQLRALNLSIDFEAGETILTEISRKFNLDSMQSYLNSLGLKPLQVWTDSNQWFGLILCQLHSKSA